MAASPRTRHASGGHVIRSRSPLFPQMLPRWARGASLGKTVCGHGARRQTVVHLYASTMALLPSVISKCYGWTVERVQVRMLGGCYELATLQHRAAFQRLAGARALNTL